MLLPEFIKKRSSYLDYTEHQFPQAFARLIDDVCSQQAEKGTDIMEIQDWLTMHLEKENLLVIEGYLIGSVLRGIFEGADVDIFLLLHDKCPDEIKTSSQKLDKLRHEFFPKFSRPLHALVFSQSERDGFYSFLEGLERKKLFIQKRGK